MKRTLFLFVFFVSLLVTAFFLAPPAVHAFASLKIDAVRVCYNGSISKTMDRYCSQGWNTANWRIRYRVRNTGDQIGKGFVCLSDISTAGNGSSMREENCLVGTTVKVSPRSYVDMNQTETLSICGSGLFMGLSKYSGEIPLAFLDRNWFTYVGSCQK